MHAYAVLRISAVVVASSFIACAAPPVTPPTAPDSADGAGVPNPPDLKDFKDDCPADANGDGKLSILDFVAFHDFFIAGAAEADMNGDGVLNLLDVIAFQDAYAAGCDDGFAWTNLQPSPDSRLIHVSTDGDDANAGTSPDTPVRTIAHACTLLRDGYPDWLLLKRGDVWINENFGRWKKSGRSGAEPIVIGAYGPGVARPRVLTGLATRGLWLDGAAGLDHVALVGIELHPHSYQGQEGAEAGVLWLGGGGDLLIEDCLIRGYKDNIVINGFGETASNIRVRGSVIVDAWSTVGHAQGLYAQEAEDILIESCVFDHNGWLEGVDGAEQTVFNHNIYIQSNCSDVAVVDCLLMDASSHAIQLRCTGLVEDCLFLSNPIGLLVGNGGEAPAAHALVADNVFLFADDISESTPRGMGIDLQNIASGQIIGNILAQSDSIHENGHAMKLHGSATAPIHDLLFAANIVHDWPGGVRFNKTDVYDAEIVANVIDVSGSDVPLIKHAGAFDAIDVNYAKNRYHSTAPEHIWFQIEFEAFSFEEWKSITDEHDAVVMPTTFIDPQRTPESYQAHLGEQVDRESFRKAVRAQGRLTWDPRYATRPILTYFQEGYAPAP